MLEKRDVTRKDIKGPGRATEPLLLDIIMCLGWISVSSFSLRFAQLLKPLSLYLSPILEVFSLFLILCCDTLDFFLIKENSEFLILAGN